MSDRHEKVVLKDEEGRLCTFKKETLIKALFLEDQVRTLAEKCHLLAYTNPPIPRGYKRVMGGEWKYGFTIKRESDGSEFVWIPVGFLDKDGTINGDQFNESFGQRTYMFDRSTNIFLEGAFFEDVESPDFINAYKSVQKYEGFYISRHLISRGEDGKLHSVEDATPVRPKDFEAAFKMSKAFERRRGVTSYLPFGSNYDSVNAWLIKMIAYMKGNTNHICDWAGNIWEVTQEFNYGYVVLRGGICNSNINCDFIAKRFGRIHDEPFYETDNVGFRVALCLK